MIRQIIQLKADKKSNRKISELLCLARTTTNKYVSLITKSGITFPELLELSDSELEELFRLSSNRKIINAEKNRQLREFFPYVQKELSRVGVTKLILWGQYRDKTPGYFGYSQFNLQFNRWLSKQDVPMHFEHKAGDKVYVDYTGKKIEIIDVETGEVRKAEIFVAILGCSQLTYVEASESQKKTDFITSVERALAFFGGVPLCIVPDNLKSAVYKSDRYEPELNESFADFAQHYSTTILPARARKPRDKALVESAVKIAYQRIFAPLRDHHFTSLEQLNASIKERLQEHNNKPVQRTGISRRTQFEALEKALLKPLPTELYEFKQYKLILVHKNSHVLLGEDKHYYSVPYQYTGEKVKITYTSSSVEVYHKFTRIAYHKRNYTPHKYTTVAEHVPSSHHFVSDWNNEKFISWATNIGVPTLEVIKAILESKLYPEQAYKSCIGILSMAKKVGNERLNNACKRAIEYQSYYYKSIKNILEKGLDATPVSEVQQYDLPFHQNIRGREFYQ